MTYEVTKDGTLKVRAESMQAGAASAVDLTIDKNTLSLPDEEVLRLFYFAEEERRLAAEIFEK